MLFEPIRRERTNPRLRDRADPRLVLLPRLPQELPAGHDLAVDRADRMDLGEVYARYGAWIRRKVRRHLPDAWEDALQETFVRLQPALERLRESREEAVRGLVSRTVRSVCIDEVRRRALRSGTVAADEVEDPTSRAETEEHAEDLALLAERWKELGERERRILVLRFRDGLSFREIAELLDVPQGSVAGWYSRALAHLREELA